MSLNQSKLETRKDFYKLLASMGAKVGCEIGVKGGANAKVMLDVIPDLMLYLVEPYFDYDDVDFKRGQRAHNLNMLEAMTRLNRKKMAYNIRWIFAKSEDAHREIPDGSLDFVYIDGNHDYDYHMMDLILYTRKVKPGGIISGHDYNFPGLRTATNDFARWHKLGPIQTTGKETNITFYFNKGE